MDRKLDAKLIPTVRTFVISVICAVLVIVIWRLVMGDLQTRFRYERRVNSEGPYYVEIYEEREQDLDSTANPQPFYTTVHRETKFMDKSVKVSQLTAERQTLVDQAQTLQQRISAINALP